MIKKDRKINVLNNLYETYAKYSLVKKRSTLEQIILLTLPFGLLIVLICAILIYLHKAVVLASYLYKGILIIYGVYFLISYFISKKQLLDYENNSDILSIITNYNNRTSERFRFSGNKLILNYKYLDEEKQDIYDLSNIYCVDYENRILSYFNNEEDIQTVYEKGNAMELLIAIPDYYEPSIMDKMPQKLKNKYFKKEEIKEEKEE